MRDPNELENARDEALLIARKAFSDTLRDSESEDEAQAAFDDALEDALETA